MTDYSDAVEIFDRAARAVDMPTVSALHDLLRLTHSVSVRNGFCAFVPPVEDGDQWACEVYASQPIGAGREVSIREKFYGDSLLECVQTARSELLPRFRWQGTEAEARGDVW